MATAPDRFGHFVAIDWSGAAGRVQPGIAIAIAGGDGPPRLVRGAERWSREAALQWLRNELPAEALIGVDLGLAFPFADRGAYFPGWDRSPADARALWALVDAICMAEPNLGASAFVDHAEASRHFRRHGGRTGDRFGSGRGRLRVTEAHQRAHGLNPYSNFNLVGAAQVGKSSLTGMRLLHRLAERIAIWPFEALPPRGSVLVEIYTTIAAVAGGRAKGRAKMRDLASLDAALAAVGSPRFEGNAPIDDHRADALLGAAWLRQVAGHEPLWRPAAMTPQIARTEGWTFGIT